MVYETHPHITGYSTCHPRKAPKRPQPGSCLVAQNGIPNKNCWVSKPSSETKEATVGCSKPSGFLWKDVVKTQRWQSKQPRGMVWKPCNYWDKLPTSTGAAFLPSTVVTIWVFPKIGGGPQNGWFIRENLIPRWFGGTPIFGNIHFERIQKGDDWWGSFWWDIFWNDTKGDPSWKTNKSNNTSHQKSLLNLMMFRSSLLVGYVSSLEGSLWTFAHNSPEQTILMKKTHMTLEWIAEVDCCVSSYWLNSLYILWTLTGFEGSFAEDYRWHCLWPSSTNWSSCKLFPSEHCNLGAASNAGNA